VLSTGSDNALEYAKASQLLPVTFSSSFFSLVVELDEEKLFVPSLAAVASSLRKCAESRSQEPDSSCGIREWTLAFSRSFLEGLKSLSSAKSSLECHRDVIGAIFADLVWAKRSSCAQAPHDASVDAVFACVADLRETPVQGRVEPLIQRSFLLQLLQLARGSSLALTSEMELQVYAVWLRSVSLYRFLELLI
jgi:hypothetical protein